MAKPTEFGLFEDAGAAVEFEDNSEVKVGKKKKITGRAAHQNAANRRTGMVIRHFVKVDGIPMAFVLVPNGDINGAGAHSQAILPDVEMRPVRGSEQSVRILAWDRGANAGAAAGPAGVGEVGSRLVRFTAI